MENLKNVAINDCLAPTKGKMGYMYDRIDYLAGLVYMMSDESSMMTSSIFRITAGEHI